MSKPKLKTNPIGVCFRIDHLAHIKVAENLSSTQKVVDFLVDMYIKKRSVSILLKERGIQVVNSMAKVEIQKEVKKEIHPIKSDDLFERFKGVKIFRIDEFTNHPDKEKPVDKFKAAEWMIQKKVEDKKIRDSWAKFLKTKS